MASLAADLKSEREKRNISLSQVAADTRISLHYLESLEGGRYSELPGGMYNRAFLRAYCETLDLDQREILQRYEHETVSPLDRVQKSRTRVPQKASGFRLSPVLIWSLALLISAAGIYLSRNHIAEVFSPYFSGKPAPDFSSEVAHQTPAPPVAAQAPAAAEPAVLPAGSGADSSGPEPALVMTDRAPAPPAAADTAGPPGALNLELTVTEPCWVSVQRDGMPHFSRLMAPGEIQSVSATEKFFLVIGNAAGVRLKINGKSAKPLGRSGEVKRIFINGQNLDEFLDRTAG